MGAKDLQCKYMSVLVSLQKTVVSNFPLHFINKKCKNDILPLCQRHMYILYFDEIYSKYQ